VSIIYIYTVYTYIYYLYNKYIDGYAVKHSTRIVLLPSFLSSLPPSFPPSLPMQLIATSLPSSTRLIESSSLILYGMEAHWVG